MAIGELTALIGASMAVGSIIGNALTRYQQSVKKEYAAQQDFLRLKRNQECLLAMQSEIYYELLNKVPPPCANGTQTDG